MKEAIEELEKFKMKYFNHGFNIAIDLVLSIIDNTDIHTSPITLRDEILEEVEAYKKDE